MQKNKPILFCDFDGVLCHEKYWRSLPTDKYQQVQQLLFGEDKSYTNDWMRGKYSAEEANRKVSETINVSYEELWELFVHDCRTMNVDKDALEKLKNLRDRYTVILITGNMDSFTRFTEPACNLHEYFDVISNSYEEGIHKTDNDGILFTKYTKRFNAPLNQCIVLDDSEKVCDVFEKLGGKSCLVSKEHDILYHLDKITKAS